MSKHYLNERDRTLRKMNYRLLYGLDFTEEGNPIIHRDTNIPEFDRMIGFNEVLTDKRPHRTAVHFFIDDYQFERIWEHPEKYAEKLLAYTLVIEPDFSLYVEYPEPIQRWNHYRNQFIGAYLQRYGCRVIPSASWNDEKSFEWCYDGVEKGSIVAISSVGTARYPQAQRGFQAGIEELVKQKSPEGLIFYGKIRPETKDLLKHLKIPYTAYASGMTVRIGKCQ